MKTTRTQLNMAVIAEKMHSMAEQAIKIIQKHSHEPVPVMKLGYDQAEGDTPNDFATQGDTEAQAMYFADIINFPDFKDFGIIGEEGLNIPCTHPDFNIYFTCDPLDGTKAYGRLQSHGVGTMLALILDDVVIAAYIGDTNTGEIYGYAIDPTTHDFVVNPTRYRLGKEISLQTKMDTSPLTKRYLVMREAPYTFPTIFREMIGEFANMPRLFKNIEVCGGSYGIHMARLWKGEIGGVLLDQKHHTPWDSAPVLGFNTALGFKAFRYNSDTQELLPYTQGVQEEIFRDTFYELIVHEDYVPELNTWLANRKK